jgi:DNA-binding transcriptional ArsR family regulator
MFISLQTETLTPRSKSPKRLVSLLGEAATLAKALSDENRLRILLFLRDGKKSVSQIVEGMELSQPLVSHHLRELKRALLVGVERKGPFVFYSLERAATIDLLQHMGSLAGELIASRRSVG